MDYKDGYLIPTLEARRDVARMVRRFRPDILVTCDPTQIFGDNSINHPDHRYVGQIVVDAFFPAAGNPLYFPELLQEEGLQPFAPKELWLTVTGNPNTTVDVSQTWQDKITALHNHVTQIGDMAKLDERMRSRHTADSTLDAPRYEEKFRRFVFR
jgi:LmbE family N-acetylglucosaminyl deacetylase